MKAPAFWYQEPGALAHLLVPVSFLWRAGGAIRRAMTIPYRARIPVICVGNIVAGGSGKTPTALALAAILRETGKKPGFVTRGYGGKELGPLRVTAGHSALDVGDEALLLARVAPAWVGRDRAAAVRMAEKEVTHILLDDGLQNPSVRPHISLLVIDGEAGLGNGYVIPAGPLRETYESAMHRITGVVLVGSYDEQRLAERVRCPLLRAHFEPALPADFPRTQKFFAFAGIGRPEKFYATCRDAGLTLVGTEDFPDHHLFSAEELASLQKKAEAQGAQLLTTEKDWVRLPQEVQARITALPARLIFEDPVAVKQLLRL